jgi:hypothetical protein
MPPYCVFGGVGVHATISVFSVSRLGFSLKAFDF